MDLLWQFDDLLRACLRRCRVHLRHLKREVGLFQLMLQAGFFTLELANLVFERLHGVLVCQRFLRQPVCLRLSLISLTDRLF